MLLSSNQKTTLLMLAKEAFRVQRDLANCPDMNEDQFRKVTVWTATNGEANGLSTATNAHFLKIKGAFLNLAAREAEAFDSAMAEGSERRDRIVFRIIATAKKAGLSEPYIAAVCRGKFSVGDTWRDDLTEDQLIQLSATLEQRAKSRRQKAAAKS